MVLAYVSFWAWIIDPYEQCFFYQSAEVLVLPPHYSKIFYSDIVTSGVKMIIYWGGCLQEFFEPLSKCSSGLSNVFLITFHPVTFVSIYDSTFLLDGILIFWSHQKVLDDIASFKVDLHSMFAASFLYAFTDSFVIRNHHMWFLDVVTRVLGTSAVLVSCGFGFDFYPVQCPCRVFASCCSNMVTY